MGNKNVIGPETIVQISLRRKGFKILQISIHLRDL